MKTPTISVLTPLYNTKEPDLRAMIESILGQTYGDFEFLLLNDSPDNPDIERIVKSYNDNRIRYLENKCNMGITKSRNKLIDLARGKYIAVADHDDISTPRRFELEAAFLDANPHVGAVGGNVVVIKDGVEHKTAKRPTHDNDIKISLINEAYTCNPIHSGCMIRKSVLDETGVRYNEKWSPCEDRILFMDLIPHTCFHNIKDIVLKYVWTGDNTTLRQWQRMYDLPPMIVANAREKYPVYYDAWKRDEKNHQNERTTKRIKLLGFLPFIKIRFRHGQKKIYLFDFIQLARIKYDL